MLNLQNELLHAFGKVFAEGIGWFGTACVIGAYTLLSFDILNPHTILFQAINLTGCACLIYMGRAQKSRQTVTINVVWGTVALVSLIRMLPGVP